MSRLIKWVVLGLLLSPVAGLVYADGTNVATTGVIPVTANVGGNLCFSWELYDMTGYDDFSWSAPKGFNTMEFGSLEEDPASNDYFSPSWFTLILYTFANVSYNIQQASVGLSDGAGHDLDNSFTVKPDYKTTDKWDGIYEQGSKGTDVVGAESLVDNANILYAGNEGKGRIIRFYYAIPVSSTASGFTPVPDDQAPGDYTGSVTISIVAQ